MQRMPRFRNRAAKVDSTKLRELLDAAVAAHKASEAAQIAEKRLMDELIAAMKSAKLTEFSSGGWSGVITKSAGRATNTVDPAAFRKLIKNDKEFYSAVSVSIVDARKLLPGKILDKITTTTQGKPGPEKITLVESK